MKNAGTSIIIVLVIVIVGLFFVYIYGERRQGSNQKIGQEDAKWQRKTDMPTPRAEVSGAAINGKIYVIGGIDNFGKALGTVEIYDPATDSWSSAPDLPKPCHHCPVVALGNNLYVLGGFQESNWEPTTDVFMFDLKNQKWTKSTSLPIAQGALAATVIGNKIFAIGGIVPKEHGEIPLGGSITTVNPNLATTKKLIIYDSITEKWAMGSPAQTARHHLAAVAINGLMYVAGGREQALYKNIATLEIYDPKTETWKKGPPMPTARSGVEGTVVRNIFVIAGGEDSEVKTFDEVEIFDATLKKWINLPTLPEPRHGSATSAIGNNIYVIGGSTKPGLSSVGSVSGRNEVLELE
jgi:N-acetylneuraminic acid mutarotase